MFMINISFASWSSLVFAILQSACTAVIAISGLRVAIGLSALAAAAGIHAPARGFHQDAIRIPMMVLAFLGAVINLYVVGKVRRLRNKPAAQWRQQPVTKQKLNSEHFQIALAILTLILLAAEWITHPMVHRVP
jgi:MFS family permease